MLKLKNQKIISTDIALIGGGHAGLALSILLGAAGIKVICIDAQNPKDFTAPLNARTTAISFGSSKLLTRAGIWQALLKHACPIHDIRVYDGSNSPLYLDFLTDKSPAQKDKDEALGWVIENIHIRKALYQKIKSLKNVTLLSSDTIKDMKRINESLTLTTQSGKTIHAPLAIGADGRQSFTRQWAGIKTRSWSYDQNAIVCVTAHENPHNNKAIEQFYKQGPFAILPMIGTKAHPHRSSIVWTEEKKTQNSALDYTPEVFNAALNARFPAEYGRVKAISDSIAYPLNFIHAHDYIADNIALIGDAAHGIHPIAGQGLNLGLKDVACLADLLIAARKNQTPYNSANLLGTYRRERRKDNALIAGATDTLNGLFASNHAPVKLARRAGLKAAQNIPLAKKFFLKKMMGE